MPINNFVFTSYTLIENLFDGDDICNVYRSNESQYIPSCLSSPEGLKFKNEYKPHQTIKYYWCSIECSNLIL